MTSRNRHGIFILVAIPVLFTLGRWGLHHKGMEAPFQIKALVWATVANTIHSGLGWRLWKTDSSLRDSGISSGLSILAVRFISGAGLVATGFVLNPQSKELFAFFWSGMFLILFISEAIIFIQGVQEL